MAAHLGVEGCLWAFWPSHLTWDLADHQVVVRPCQAVERPCLVGEVRHPWADHQVVAHPSQAVERPCLVEEACHPWADRQVVAHPSQAVERPC